MRVLDVALDRRERGFGAEQVVADRWLAWGRDAATSIEPVDNAGQLADERVKCRAVTVVLESCDRRCRGAGAGDRDRRLLARSVGKQRGDGCTGGLADSTVVTLRRLAVDREVAIEDSEWNARAVAARTHAHGEPAD